MYKYYKYRLYPNKEQEYQIQKTFGCCRFVYNQLLAYRKEKYETLKESMNRISCNNYCNQVLKKDYLWLKEVDKWALSNAIFNMDAAFQNFFKKRTGYPKFKSKNDNNKSYKTNFANGNIKVDFENNKIQLPKLKLVKCNVHRVFDGQIKSAIISQVPSGKYFVSVLVETEHKILPQNSNMVGIDLGIKDLLITSDGEKFDNIKMTNKYEKKLAKLQRQFAKKQKGSENRNKQRIKIARLYERISNIRKDNLNKISYKLVNENQVIVSENLKIKNMLKNHNLAKSIFDCGWGELTNQISYKSIWNNREYIKIDTYFPSSQLCNACGYQNKDIKNLNIREWDCPNCGTHHDRDTNAAINILNEGLKQII